MLNAHCHVAMDHLKKLGETYFQKITPVQKIGQQDVDYMPMLKRYLVLKYIQYMILPSTNIMVLGAGAFGTLYISFLMLSKVVTRKCTTVFISHLVTSDAVLLPAILVEVLHEVTDVKLASNYFIKGLIHNFVTVNAHTSSLMLSCISLEAFLITQFPVQSRFIRTVKRARMTSTLIWIAVLTECIILQTEYFTSSDTVSLGFGIPPLSGLFHLFLVIAPIVRMLSNALVICLRIVNVFFYYKVYMTKSYSRHFLKRKA
ncbi:uncharacterized protein LOC103177844 [Callorhinchus milii]|nr:uncharacterized protein LOC103177844 [Callorhinchus milii]